MVCCVRYYLRVLSPSERAFVFYQAWSRGIPKVLLPIVLYQYTEGNFVNHVVLVGVPPKL